MISAEQFIAILEQKDLLPAAVVAQLRAQIERSDKPIPAETVAKRLIDKGYLTVAIAKRLLAETPSAEGPKEAKSEARSAASAEEDDLGLTPLPEDEPRPARQQPKKPAAPPADEDDDLGLIPLPEAGAKPAAKEAKKPAAAPPPEEEEEFGLIPLDEPPAKPAAAKPAAAKPAAAKPAAAKPAAKPAAPAADDDLGLIPLDDAPAKPAPAAPKKPAPAPKKPAAKTPPPAASQPAAPVRAEPASLLDEELSGGLDPLGLNPLDGLLDQAGMAAAGPGPLAQGPAMTTPLGAAGPLDAVVEEKEAEKPSGKKFKKKTQRENIWDSPLLLIGGGALALLVIMMLVLLWAFTRQGGDELFRLADEEYRRGSYTQAIHKYGIYLREYPAHPQASLARVRRGLAQLRQAVEGTANSSKALTSATQILAEIAVEADFKTEAQPELIALLPTIAQGLVNEARQTQDPKLAAQTKEALALVEKYVPKSMRPTTKLADIEAALSLTEREIARNDELRKAIAGMQAALKAGKTEEAYRVRDALLKQYPSLVSDKDLQATILEVSRSAQSAVKNVDQAQEAVREDPASGLLATLALATRTSDAPPPSAEGQVVAVLAEGAAYGLEGTTGKVLWRRPIGYQTNGRSPSFPPTPVDSQPGSDFLLVDASQGRHDVLRVEATTGRLRWRHPVGDRFDAHPAPAGKSVLVATRSGRVVPIDLESGASPGYLHLPQSLRVAPCVDVSRSNLYQLADHSNLFVLNLGEPGVKQVVYLGHDTGSVTAPPVIISRFLIVAENNRAEDATLRVLTLEDSQNTPAFTQLQTVRLRGRVDTAPVAQGLRLLTVTDQGNLYVFEASASDLKNPLVLIGEGKAAGDEPVRERSTLARYLLLLGSQAFVADTQLTRYDLQASRGKLHPRGIHNELTAALQPLTALGKSVVHVRRKIGLPGVLVSAMNVTEGKPYWETHLASPLLGEPAVDASGRVTAATSNGAVFQVDAKALKPDAVLDQPSAAMSIAELRESMSDCVLFPSGLVAIASVDGPKQIAVTNPQAGQSHFRWIKLPDPLGGRPMAFAGGLVAPCKVGQVFLLDPETGAKRTEPFQPHLESGAELMWRGPALVGDKEFVIADNRDGLYRVGIKQEPKPHLAALATAKTREPIVSSLAVLGKVVYAMDAQKTLSAYDLPGLTLGQQWPLDGPCVWGPQTVGDRALVVTYDEKATDPQQLPYKLSCLDASKTIVWQVALPDGPLAGPPLAMGDKYVLASVGGKLWSMDAASGQTVAEADLGHPLGTGVVPLGKSLLCGGHDGSLYVVKLPWEEQHSLKASTPEKTPGETAP